MLPQILYVLQEAGKTASLQEIITKVQKLDEGKWTGRDGNAQSLAVQKALVQGVQFGFISSDRSHRTFKLMVNFLLFENYHFNNKLRALSEEFSLYGLTEVFKNMDRYMQSDISDDDSAEQNDSVAYDSDDERTPTPKKKKMIRKGGKISKLRKKRIFAAGVTPKKLPRKGK